MEIAATYVAKALLTVQRFCARFEEAEEAPKFWQNQLIQNHVAHHRWFYGSAWLLLSAAVTVRQFSDAMEFSTVGVFLSLLACVLLLYVSPFARWAPARFLQRFVIYLIALLSISGLLCLTACSVVELFDRSSAERFAALTLGHKLADSDTSLFFLWMTLLGFSVMFALGLTLVRKSPVPRVRLAYAAFISAVAAITVCYPTSSVMSAHSSGAFLADLNMSSIDLMIALIVAIWSSGALLVLAHARPVECPSLPSGESSATEFMKSASSIATTALVIVFFGLNTCWGYTRSLSHFITARDAFAEDLIAASISANQSLTGSFNVQPSEIFIAADGRKELLLDKKVAIDTDTIQKAYPPGSLLTPQPALSWLQQVKVISVKASTPDFLDNFPAGTQIEIEVSEVTLPHSWKARPILKFPNDLKTTHDVASAGPCSDKLDEGSTYDQLYRSCEKAVIGRGVKFPLLDTEVPIEYVVTAAFIAVAGCIVLLTDRIQAVLNSPPTPKIEPWIVLDATSRSGKIIANAWVLGLAATPWLLMGFAVALNALQIRVAGSVSTVREDAVVAALGCAGVCVSPFLSASLLRHFTAMRFVRRCRWLAAENAVNASGEAAGG